MSPHVSEEPTAMSQHVSYDVTVNGATQEVTDAWIGESLLYVLRERLGLPGSKNACEQGECGSCSVVLDGELVCACLVLGASAADSEVTTIEGVTGPDGQLTEIQQAFLDNAAVQCGFCTPGLIVALEHLLDHDPAPTELAVREAISGNLCRCTGYGRIFAAVEQAIEIRTGSRP